MLSIFFIKFNFHRFCQSGCYFDFFYKKISEVFVRNIFVYAAQFIGEKYMIEYLTKTIFNKFVFFFNKIFGVNNLSYYLIFNVPVLLIRWLYELFHTFFMVIFQFIAFFAMIF